MFMDSINAEYNIVKEFYSTNNINFKDITKERLIYLKNESNKFKETMKHNNFFTKTKKYTNLMKGIKIEQRRKNYTEAEKVILFMLSIDPNFEAIMLLNECNKLEEVRLKMVSKFGIYDKNLIKIEKYFINNFLNENSKNIIDQEINKRTFK